MRFLVLVLSMNQHFRGPRWTSRNVLYRNFAEISIHARWWTCSRHGFLYIRGWMQMVIAPNDLFSWNNKYNEYNVTKDIYTFSSWSYARELTLCMLAFWSHEGVVFLDFLPFPHLVTSFHLPCLGSTDALSPLGRPGPSTSKMPPPFHRVRAPSLTRVYNRTFQG